MSDEEKIMPDSLHEELIQRARREANEGIRNNTITHFEKTLEKMPDVRSAFVLFSSKKGVSLQLVGTTADSVTAFARALADEPKVAEILCDAIGMTYNVITSGKLHEVDDSVLSFIDHAEELRKILTRIHEDFNKDN